MVLHRYWFVLSSDAGVELPPGTGLGCGVTAATYDAAVDTLRERVFSGRLPPIQSVVEDVDISSLDPGHVRPNMGSPLRAGIWVPLGYS